MAVPTIATVSPDRGHTGGRMIVEITGTGFRLPTIGVDQFPARTVAVYFGAARSPKVDVATDGRLFALTPKHEVGAADVRVVNVDDDDNPIAGEEVIATGAFTFARPIVTSEYQGELTQLIRTLITDFRLQLTPNVAIATHADYQSAGGVAAYVTELAALPGIVLIGPETEENRFYSLNEEPEFDVASDGEGPTEFARTAVPRTLDVMFSIFGFSNLKQEASSLQSLIDWFFKENKFFSLTDGAIRDDDGNSYEMDLTTPTRAVGGANNDNLHGFAARMTIRGFDVNLAPGLEIDSLASQTKHRGAYTDDQGAVVTAETISVQPILAVKSVLTAKGLGLSVASRPNPVVRSIRSPGQ